MARIVHPSARAQRASNHGRRRLGAVGLLAITLLSACASPAPSPSSSTTPRTAPSPAGSGVVGPSSGPVSTDGTAPNPSTSDTWGKLDLPEAPPVAAFEATKRGDAGVALETAFRLTSLDGTPVEAMASHLSIDPALALSAGTPSQNTVLLRPSAALTAGTTYHVKLRRPDGTTAASWAVTAAHPLHVVGTLPADQATDVPRDTGIEITFDQTGVTAAALDAAFSIKPAVNGRFEVHGRVIAFVPTTPLKALTIYTVTIRHGLALPGTGQVLAKDQVVRFETRGKGADQTVLDLFRTLNDSATAERPVVPVSFQDADGDDPKAPKSLDITVDRLAGLGAAMDAYRALAQAPAWARTGGAPIKTGSLTDVLRATVPVHTVARGVDYWWIEVPQRLPSGWYVLTASLSNQRRQVLLQVSNVAVYAVVTTTRTTVWVNDLASRGPIAGATVRLADASLGRTDGRGLRTARTPRPARVVADSGDPLFVTVRDGRGRTMFAPIDGRGVCGKCDLGAGADGAHDAWWHVLAIDRTRYRRTDQANVWGVVRPRDGGAVPRSLDVRLSATDGSDPQITTIVERHVTPTAAGAFSATLPFRDLPPGDYQVQIRAGSTLIDEAGFSVGAIVKPGYAMTVATDKHAVIVGDPVVATTQASFFEGTPVAGVDLTVGFAESLESRGTQPAARTDAAGHASVSLTAPVNGSEDDADDSEQWWWRGVFATPTLPEEAGINGSASVAIFRSDALLDTDASLTGQHLSIGGSVHDVAFDKFGDVAAYQDVDPRGAPRAGAKVDVTITELVPVRHRAGTYYDFVTKRARVSYNYTFRRVPVSEKTVTTATDGTFSLSTTVNGGDNGYEVRARYADPAHRVISMTTEAYGAEPVEQQDQPRLESTVSADDIDREFSIGQRVSVTVHGQSDAAPSDRYLFTVVSRGLRAAVIQRSGTYATTFREAWVPNAQIGAVRFTGDRYEPAQGDYYAGFDSADRALQVSVTPSAARYEPGSHVALSVRTARADGTPVAASVVVRVIDEKLYAAGLASDVDLRASLYASVSTGVTGSAWSHRPVSRDYGFEGGDTTGGGGDDRVDFRDWLVFRLVTTGSDGRASVGFDLSDDLTSWRVSASAVDTHLRAGDGIAHLPVGLPFFAEATVAPEYLASDHAIIRLRGFGSALHAGDRVTFTVSAPSLGLAPVTATAAAFEAAEVRLPDLTTGDHQIRITASSGSGSSHHDDALVRTIHVVTSRSVQGHTVSAPLAGAYQPPSGVTGLTTVTVADAGRGRVLPLLLALANADPERADTVLAAAQARRVLAKAFGLAQPATDVADDGLERFQTPGQGVAILPYASPDLELSALAAMTDDTGLDRVGLARSFHELGEDGDAPTRERRIVALAGSAALGEPVLDEILDAAASKDLTALERAWLAIAAVSAGDASAARDLERGLLAQYGQRLGPWVRISVGDDTTTMTALVEMVAAGIGDPLAADMDAYLESNPTADTVLALQRVLAARSWVERTPGAAAAISVTVDGTTRPVDIAPDRPMRLTLTPDQLAGFRLSPTSGKSLVTTSWEAPLDAASMHGVEGIAFSRTPLPDGAIAADAVVIVSMDVTLGSHADQGCWLVTDLVPSGLAAIGQEVGWYGEVDDGSDGVAPWRVEGQRVDFCVAPDPEHTVQHLRYAARVVTPGTYRWEPAVLQSSIVRDRGIVLPAFEITIRGTS